MGGKGPRGGSNENQSGKGKDEQNSSQLLGCAVVLISMLRLTNYIINYLQIIYKSHKVFITRL